MLNAENGLISDFFWRNVLANEKTSSSPPKNSPKPLDLLQTLATILSVVLVGYYFLKSHATTQCIDDSANPNRGVEKNKNLTPSISNHIPPSPTDPDKPCQCCHHKVPRWKMFLDVLLTLSTLGAFVAAFWYARVANQQLRTTKNYFKTDERAWVGIEIGKPILNAAANGKFPASYAYEITARNTGKTVARCVEIRSPKQGELGNLANAENKEVIDNTQDRFLLGKYKNSEDIPIIQSVSKVLAPGQVTPLPVTLVGQGPQYNFGSTFIGRLDYIDEFNVRHWVKFCFVVQNANGELGYCKYGNDEDSNTEDTSQKPHSCPVTRE